jgi:hypothetical protein
LIWCNYGFSFLNGNDANIFLEKAKSCLKGNGILMIKDVIAEEENCAAVYFREEERVFYDHYRNKLNKMEKPGGEANSSDPEKHEKYIRN